MFIFPSCRQFDEYSQGSGAYMEDDYEQALREYGHSQRERHERSSQSPPGYDEMYYERGSQSGHDMDLYEKHRYTSYRSLSPGSDHEMDIAEDEFRYKTRTPSDERYYYKEKYYDEARSRDRSHSSDSEQRYRLSSEVVRRRSRSRSPTLSKLKRTKELPISYRSHSPPTPTEEEGYYHSDNNSPTDFESAYRKYGDYKKKQSSSSVEGDRKSGMLINTGLRKEIESKSEERSSRKRSYDQLSPKRSDSLHRIERQHSRGSRTDSLFEYSSDKLSAKELIAKVQRLRSEVNERLGVKDSPSSSSNSEIDPSTLTESDLIKLHREKQKLLQKLTLLDDNGNISDNESDSRHGSSKKARMDLKYLQKSDSLTKQELKEKLKHLDETQSYRKQMDALRKKDLLRDYKKSKSAGDMKKDMLDYSEEDNYSLNSPREYPSGFMPKKRRKVEGESDRKSRSYRMKHDDDQVGYSSDDEKEKHELLRQSSAHADLYSSKSRTLSSLDARLESAEFSSHSKEDSRRVSSGSDNNKEHSEHSGRSHRRHKKRDNHITPLIPLGDDDMPDPETSDPRLPRGKCERPQVLPLPDFAQFIQFSPLPSPHHSPERYSDLPSDSGRGKLRDSAVDSGNADTAYQSPCFSPQSSSSKTHSPSQSPSGSGSDTKANTNSDSGSGELPLGFPTETEQIDPDANKTDSLDSVPDPTKMPKESKEHDDSFSDNNSDDNLMADNLSIEERIRQLDEKWNKAQAVAAVTPKVVPDVDSMVNNSSSTPSPLLTPYTTAPALTTAAASPTTSALYSKYRIRKRNDPTGSGTEKGEGPSEIVQTVLSKSSIFDQDSKRLGQTDESSDFKEASPANDNSPKPYSAWTKTDVKENPMVTVPGSLLDRLGQGNNGSFPTLTVNTTFPSATNVSVNKTDSMNTNLFNYDARTTKLSPLPTLDIPNVNEKNSLSVSPKGTEDIVVQKHDLSEHSPVYDRNGLNGSDLDLTKTETQKSPVLPKSILKNRSDSNISLMNSEYENKNSENQNDVQSPSGTEAKLGNCVQVSKAEPDVKKESIKNEIPETSKEHNLNEEKSCPVNGENESLKGEQFDVKKVTENSVAVEEMDTAENLATCSADKDKSENVSTDPLKIEIKEEKFDIPQSESTSLPLNESKDVKIEQPFKSDVHVTLTDKIKEETDLTVKTEPEIKVKQVLDDNKMELESSLENKKVEQKIQPGKPSDKDKHSTKDSSKSTKDNTFKEPSHKKQKLSKDSKDKKSDSSHKDEKHKKKESDKKSESSHKTSSDKKDDKHKDKHKSKSDKDKKEGEKKLKDKEEKKESKDEKKKKVEKKEKKEEKSDKESKDDKSEKHSKDKKEDKSHSKDSENKESKEKGSDKKEKSEKKHEKKEGHKHDKHGLKSPDKKSKSSHKEEDGKEKTKDSSHKESVPKEGSSKEGEKDKQDKDKTDKSEKKSESSKKEHKSSSHKSKKSKEDSSKKSKDESTDSKPVKDENTEAKKSKDEESKKVKDDHNEHKKKEETNNRNNKDSPDKNKDVNRKESSEKKSTDKTKEKPSSSEKCKEDKPKNKEKENKDKDPDHTKSKSTKSPSSAESSDKPKTQTSEAKVEKPKAENDKDDSKKSENKEEKKSKDSEVSKSTNSSKKSSKETDSHKKSSKCDKSSKIKSELKKEIKNKEKQEADTKSKKETPKKKETPVYNGLTEEDLAIFAKFADESSLSMYAKVKRRSTEKKLHHDREHEEQKKLLCEYKKTQKTNKKHSLSDITESSEVSSDDNTGRKKSGSGQKSKKKFVFSSDESDSSTDTGADILHKKNKSKLQLKKPKRILDIYSSDSEEEERSNKTPSKKSTLAKKEKAEVHREQENKFEFDSISDSDNKTSATKQAKVKTKTKPNKKPSKSKSDSKSQSKSEKKEDLSQKKPKLQRKDLSFKDLFSDDSDDSMDSDSDSDIMMPSKTKKRPFISKSDKNKKKLPRGSSIYTSSEDSDSESDHEFMPMSPPKTTVLPKKTDKKVTPFKEMNKRDHESDSLTSDTEIRTEKNKKNDKLKMEKKQLNSFDSDGFLSDPESHKVNKVKMDSSDSKLKNRMDISSGSDIEKKLKKQESKEKLDKDLKFNNNKKLHDIITDDGRYDNLSKLEIAKVYSETVYEKDTFLSNLTNKDNLPPILTDMNKESLFKLDVESVRNDIPTLKDLSFEEKSSKNKNKKHKKENKKKKKSKEKVTKEPSKEKADSVNNKVIDSKPDMSAQKTFDQSEQLRQDSDVENVMNAVNRNLFDEMKTMKSPEGKKGKIKKDKDAVHNSSKPVKEKEQHVAEPERLSDSDFLSDSEKKKLVQTEKAAEVEKKPPSKKSPNSDVFDFQEEESKIKPIKESHMKIMKPDSYDVKVDGDHQTDTSATVPVEIQGVEIEYTTEEQDYKDEGNVCPEVETTEVVIEEAVEMKSEKEKPKPRKRKGRKNSGKEGLTDLTEEAVSSLSKENKIQNDIQTEVQFEAPVSNEQELVIDEGVSLHVEDETDKAVESIVNDENDETAKAVESILLDGMPTYAISEPVEPTPQLDQNYLQPEFAPGLPATVPQVGTEVETGTANTPLKGKKGRKGRRTKSGQGDALLNENSNKIPDAKPFDLLGDSAFASDISNSIDQNDDDDDGRLQIDFDPPKPEAKQKKPRKPKQTKAGKMNDAAALAAENKLDNLFGNFNQSQNKDELNRDSLSSESSELERAKHEDLLFMDREDQRHDSDMMSPDERSTSDDLTSPDVIKAKPKRGRKPKNKEAVNTPIPRTNSPRATRTLSPRSPRSNFDPKSPEPKLNGPKNLIIDEGNKIGTNVFDFDDDESGSNVNQTTTATKQRKPRQRKKAEPGLQSPENRGLFSSPEHSDKLVIGSPESKGMFTPEHKVQYNNWEKKGLFSPTFQPEEPKLDVKSAADDKQPEPLFKAFFEGKPKNEKEKKGMSSPKEGENKGLTPAQVMSNVDKTIEDVSKGLFESTDDEAAGHSFETTIQKKRQSRKSKEDDLKSPLKSPIPKSPMVKSPVVNHMNSPPPVAAPHQQPLVLPGMGIGQPSAQAQIGEPQVAGHIGMFGQMSPPVSVAANRAPVQVNNVQDTSRSQEEPQKNADKVITMTSPKTTVLLTPAKSAGITTIAQATGAPTVTPSSISIAQDLRKVEETLESAIKSSVPGFLIPAISASSAISVMQGMTSAANTAQTTVVSSTTAVASVSTAVTDMSKRQQHIEKLTHEQLLEQQKIAEQKQAELQRQQEHHVKLKEMELKKQLEHQKHLEEQHRKLQEQIKNKELQDMKSKEEALKKEQEKKRLEEHYKMLQQQHEQLRQQALQAGTTVGPGPQPGQQALLSPGALQRARPSLPSPNDGKTGPRPQVSAHHQMPPGPFGLAVRPGQFPAHLTQAQLQAVQQQLVQPLGQDKPPTSAEMALKHQQLQQQIAAQQKAQAQALAEQQAQIAKQQATQAKQSAQQTGKQPAGKGGPAVVVNKKGPEIQVRSSSNI